MAFEDFWMSETAPAAVPGAGLRFNYNGGGQCLRRDNATSSPAARQKWTQSAWVKFGNVPFDENRVTAIFGASSTTTDAYYAIFASSGQFQANQFNQPVFSQSLYTSALYRDPTAWYHFCIAVDTTQAVASDRVKIYVNGVQISSFATSSYPSQNFSSYSWNDNSTQVIGGAYVGSSITYFFDGYMADIINVDEQQLPPTTFGYFDSNNVWVPKTFQNAVSSVGSFGTNGFALSFDAANFNAATSIWADQSGNGHDFYASQGGGLGSPWNCLVGSGSPTAGSGIYGDGSDIVNDGPTANMLNLGMFTYPTTLANAASLYYTGRTQMIRAGGTSFVSRWSAFSFIPPTGKYYIYNFWNWYNNFVGGRNGWGGMLSENWYQGGTAPTTANAGNFSYFYNNTSTNFPTVVNGGAAFSTGTQNVTINANQQLPMWFYVDMDNGKMWICNNNDLGNGDPAAGTNPLVTWSPGNFPNGLYFGNLQFQTGGGGFSNQFVMHSGGLNSYSEPTNTFGFSRLQASSFPTPAVPNGATGFQDILGTDATILTQAQTAFANGLWWLKIRGPGPGDNQLVDSVRGAGQMLRCPGNANQSAFSFPGGAGNYVAWCWNKSASTGFDIISYTGDGAPSQTISHGLGSTPRFMIVKQYAGAGSNDYYVYHSGSSTTPQNDYYNLNLTGSVSSSVTVWNNTAPTAANFTVGSNNGVNAAGNSYIAYVWSDITGYSSFGNYTGNGSSDGPFVYTGFAPELVILKASSGTSGSWYMYGWANNGRANLVDLYTSANLSLIEQTDGSNYLDFLSNGFKIRTGGASGTNQSGAVYIYMAWAANPFGGSNVAPVTAR